MGGGVKSTRTVGLRYECNCRDGSFNRVEDVEVIHTGIWPHMHAHLQR